MTVNPNLPCDEEDIVDSGNAGDVAVLTPPLPNDDSMLEDAVTETAAAHSPHGAEAEYDGARCVHCESPMAAGRTFCRRCGFYPALKTFVEVEGDEDGSEPDLAQPAKSHWEVWKSLIPPWAWALMAGVVALLAMSFAARLLVPEGTARATWTYAQFGAGVFAVIAAHVACYMFAIMHNDSLSFIDIVLKPFVIWMATLQELPTSFKRVALGAWGFAAALFAAIVVAGVQYDEIIDWGKVPPKKAKKTIAIPIDAPADDNKSMEEAIDDFSKKAGVGPGDGKGQQQQEKGNRQKMTKCLIIGFTPNRESDFGSLILAVEEGGGKWRFAGVASQGVPIEVRSILNRRMRSIMRPTPVVPCDLNAFWLEPMLMCTVWYEDWTAEGWLRRPIFDKLQPDFEPRTKKTRP